MTSTSIFSEGSNSHFISSSIHRNRISTKVTSCFAINVISYLCPGSSIPVVYSYMTSICSISIIFICSNSYFISSSIHRNRMSTIVTSCFAINVSSYLCPISSIPVVYSYMTSIRSIFFIFICTNSYSISSSIHGNRRPT